MTKTIPTTVGILIVVLIAGVAGISVLFLSQEDEEMVLSEDEKIKEEEKVRKNTENFEDLLKVIDSNCSLELSKEEALQNGEYDGFTWLKGGEAHLIQGYMFVFESDVRKKRGADLIEKENEEKKIIYLENPGYDFYIQHLPMDMAKEKSEEKIGYVLSEKCGSKVLDYLVNNFTKNQQNSSNGYILGFERDDVKCIYAHFSHYERGDNGVLHCGDIGKSKTPDEYSEIFKATYRQSFPVTTTFRIGRIEDDFALVGTGHAGILLKKKDNKWQYLQGSQDGWMCEVVFENNVPPHFVNNACSFHKEGKIEFWEYNKEKEEWILESEIER